MAGRSNPISDRSDRIHVNCLAVSDRALYSASVDDKAIVRYHLDTHETGPFANRTRYPVVERLVSKSPAQLISENDTKKDFDNPLYLIARSLVARR